VGASSDRRTPGPRVGEQAQDLALHVRRRCPETGACWSCADQLEAGPVAQWRAGIAWPPKSRWRSCRPWSVEQSPQPRARAPVGASLCVQLLPLSVRILPHAHRVRKWTPVVSRDCPMAATHTHITCVRLPRRLAISPVRRPCSPSMDGPPTHGADHNHVVIVTRSRHLVTLLLIMLRVSWSVVSWSIKSLKS